MVGYTNDDKRWRLVRDLQTQIVSISKEPISNIDSRTLLSQLLGNRTNLQKQIDILKELYLNYVYLDSEFHECQVKYNWYALRDSAEAELVQVKKDLLGTELQIVRCMAVDAIGRTLPVELEDLIGGFLGSYEPKLSKPSAIDLSWSGWDS